MMKNKKPVRYLGWIYRNKNDEKQLRELGTEGQMNWSQKNSSRSKNGIFEMCEVPADKASQILPKLTEEYPLLDTVPFTGVDERGRPVCGLNWRDGSPAYNNEWHPQ